MNGYCFNQPGPDIPVATAYWVTIYHNNLTVYDQMSGNPGSANLSLNFNLADIPGYNQNSTITIYIYPNTFSVSGVNTTFVPNADCNALADGQWSAAGFSVDLTASFQQTAPTAVNCTFNVPVNFTCCNPVTVANASSTICSGESTAAVTTWQNSVTAANPNCVVFSGVTPVSGSVAPDNTFPSGINNTGAPINQTVSAYAYCDADGSGTVNVGDIYTLLSTYTLTVNPPVTPTFNPVAAVCQNAPAPVLPNTSTNNVTGTWSPAVSTSTPGTTTYTFTPSPGQCATSTTTNLTVNPNPSVNAGEDRYICLGDGIQLDGSGQGTLTWTPATGLSNSNIANPIATPATTTTYTLNATQNGCSGSDQVTINVTIPPPVIIPDDTVICVGECINIPVSGGIYYSWSPTTGLDDPASSSPTACPATTTTYTVTSFSPSVNIVVNGDFEQGNTGFSSSYQYSVNVQAEGTYYVTTNAALNHPAFVGTDHTTGSGNFMVVNGSQVPNTNVWCQNIIVQPNTEYIFSAWVSSMVGSNPAILQFSINGNVLGNPFTAPANINIWEEFFATWNSGVNTSANICIVNQNTALGGNDFGLDDIFFSPVCQSTADITITVYSPVNPGINPAGPFCENEASVNLTAANPGGSWSGTGITDAANGTFSPATAGPGTHTITYTLPNSCGSMDMEDIVVLPIQTGQTVNASICVGDSYSFGGQTFTVPGSYPVVFQNISGCDSTVTLNLSTIPATGSPPASNFFNTGTNGSGGTLPGGVNDLNWTVSTNSINGPYVPAVVMSSTPGSYYNSPWPDCRWISHSANGSHSVNSDYFYRISFDLPCANPCGESFLNDDSFCLNLDFFADNSVYEIFVNGVPQSAVIGNMPVPNPYYAVGFQAGGMVSVSLCDDWQPGTNTLIVQVVSGPGYAGFLAQSSINPPPSISDTISTSICQGETLQFGTQTLTQAGTYTEVFQILQGCDSTATLILSVNPVYDESLAIQICDGDSYTFAGQTYTTPGSYPVNFNTVFGCDSTVTLNLSLYPEYSAAIDTAVCEGQTISFQGVDYGPGVYPITFATVNGCDSTITLTVNQLPSLNFTINPVNAQCLDGNSFSFSIDQNYGPGATYSWNFPNGTPASSTNSTVSGVTFSQAGSYNAEVTVSENGCTGNAQTTITIYPNPIISFNAISTSGCAPLTVTFTNQSTPPDANFIWNFGNGQTSETYSNVSITYTNQGSYTVSLSASTADGCQSSLAQNNYILVLPAPTAGFSVVPPQTDMANPQVMLVDGSIAPGTVYYVLPNGQTVSGANAIVSFYDEGIYEIMQIVSSPGGCTDTAYGYVLVNGSSEIFIPNAFTPNDDPFNNGFGVTGYGFSDFKIMIFNRWGELLFESSDPDTKWDGTFRGKPVKPDVYMYKVIYNDHKGLTKNLYGSVTLLR
jgi:gliding motility-associated-like protein